MTVFFEFLFWCIRPSTNYEKLEGSGSIQVRDKKLSKIPLLGVISEVLANLTIPIPTASLTFNKLDGLFEFKNNRSFLKI